MVRKKKTVKEDDPSEHWKRSDTFMIHSRYLVRGTELSIQGERGRFKFVQHVYNPELDVEWIDVIGGKRGVKEFRSFRPERVKRVHYKKKLRPDKHDVQ